MDEQLLQIIKEILEMLNSQEGFAEMLSDADLPPYDGINTFKENGMLTKDLGLVLSLGDGSEYQLTLKRSKLGNPNWDREETPHLTIARANDPESDFLK